MTDYGAPRSTVTCRAIRCGAMVEQSEAVPATAVLGPNHRGWYCPSCAEWWRRV